MLSPHCWVALRIILKCTRASRHICKADSSPDEPLQRGLKTRDCPHTHMHTHTSTRTHTNARTDTCIHTQTRAHTQTHTQARTCTRINMHRHMHTHTQCISLFPCMIYDWRGWQCDRRINTNCLTVVVKGLLDGVYSSYNNRSRPSNGIGAAIECGWRGDCIITWRGFPDSSICSFPNWPLAKFFLFTLV